MRTLKAIRMFYLFYTIYTLFIVLVSDYRIEHALTGLSLMWISYFLFSIGFRSKQRVKHNAEDNHIYFPLSDILNWKIGKCVIVLICVWTASITAARFYTGRNFFSVISGLLGENNAYHSYQQYFAENNLKSFSVAKIPYVLMLAFVTIITFWSMIGLILPEVKLEWWRKIYLVGVICAYLYFGSSRGTNFETYIVFVLFAFIFFNKIEKSLDLQSIKYYVLVVAAGLLLVYVFSMRLANRNAFYKSNVISDICAEIHCDHTAILTRMVPSLVRIGVNMFGYLGYGIYCMGVAACEVTISSVKNVLSGLIPFGYSLLAGETLELQLKKTINIGARWIPDYIKIIDYTGFLLYPVLIILLGRAMKSVIESNNPRLLRDILSALLFVEMLSIPVGNFLVASSSNKLMVLYALTWLYLEKNVRIRVKK